MSVNDVSKQNFIELSQTVVYEDETEGFDLNEVIKVVLQSKGINPIFGIEVDYWSQLYQAYVSCGIYDPQSTEINFVAFDDLIRLV